MNKIGFYRGDNDELFVQKISIKMLAKKYGTPLFIYDTGLMEQSYNALKDAVNPVNGHIHYAVKANDAIAIINFFGKLGSGADIVSIGELKKCIAAKIPTNKIIFSGVGKQIDEIEFALKNNISQFNIESEEELDDIYKIAKKLKINAKIALRVNPDISPNTHHKISTGEKTTKFGINYGDVQNIYKKLNELDYIHPVGLAVHIGSQIFDFDSFNKAYSSLKRLAEELKKNGFSISNLDLGGGIGVNYEKEIAPDYTEYKKIISNIFLNSNYKFSFEPGRSLIAEAGILITKIIRKKNTKDKIFIIVDCAMNNLIRPTLYEAFHRIEPVINNNNNEIIADIVGPICETGDYLALDRRIKDVEKNEYLAIRSSGAYGSVMSSNYNARPNANEIIIHNGNDYLIKKTETIDELIKKEQLPDF